MENFERRIWVATFALFLAFLSMARAEALPESEVKALLDRIREKRAAAPQVKADFREEKQSGS